jgi:hypothetical protein
MARLPRHALAGSSVATAVTQISPWRLTIEPVRFQAINRTGKRTYPMPVRSLVARLPPTVALRED